jgi:Calcium-activated chloride channel
LQNVPSIVCTALIIIAGAIYSKIAHKIADHENHRDQDSYEYSLTEMMYKFTFWNTYTFCFLLAFWERNTAKLAQQVTTFMVGKQLGNNLVEFLKNRIYYKYKI